MINWLARPHVLPTAPVIVLRRARAPMALGALKQLMAEARALGVTCVDLAAHPEIAPYWSYKTTSDYLCPGYAGPGPSRLFLKLAGGALRDLIAQARARAAA